MSYASVSRVFGGGNTSNGVSSDSKTSSMSGAKAGSKSTPNGSAETSDSVIHAPVQHEQVNRTHEEKMTEVVDKERHQELYHTTVVPVAEQEVRETEHKYKQAPGQERNFSHEDAAETNKKLDAEAMKFKNTTTTGDTTLTKTIEPTQVVETNIITHYHEIIQPVIEKEIIKPTVVHTTIPVKEFHHDPSIIGETTTAKTMSIDEFKEFKKSKNIISSEDLPGKNTSANGAK